MTNDAKAVIDEDAAMELYDMGLDEAAARILDMQRRQGGAGQGDG